MTRASATTEGPPPTSSREGILGWLGRLGRGDVAISTLVMLLVAVPTMVIEEDWHGRPMIDQPTHLWVVAACLVLAAFLAGGAVAGYRRPAEALSHATAAATVALAVLLGAAVCRRLLVAHEGVPAAVIGLWCLGVASSLGLSAAGSTLGRRLAPGVH